MWVSSCSLPSPIILTSVSTRTNRKRLTLKASLFNYPLASKIMVRNLPYSADESSLQKEFSNFGEIAEVKLVKDKSSKRSKGYAFIQYTSQDEAIFALESMDQKIYDGRLIYVEIARPGKDAFGDYPRTCGPPEKKQFSKNLDFQDFDEVAECWY